MEHPLPWTRQYLLHYLDGSRDPVEFEAVRAMLAPDGMLAIAVPPPGLENPEVDETTKTTDVEFGAIEIGNVYTVDPWALEAEYVATVEINYGQWPFDVSQQHVFWTTDLCPRQDGRPASYLYDRDSRKLTQLDDGIWGQFMPGGDLITGASFAPRWVLSIDTFEYALSLPPGGAISWSPDYPYAVSSPGGGGMCA